MKIYYTAPRIIQAILWLPVRTLLHILTKLKIEGKENLDIVNEKGVIFASNHTGEMDPIITNVALGLFSPMFYVARNSNFYDGSGWRNKIYGGKLFALYGAYPAGIGKKDYEESLKHHIKILSAGCNVHIFPEGTRLKEKEVTDKAHGGVAFLAEKTGALVVPVAIKGASKTTFKNFFYNKKRYSVGFGKPLLTKDIFNGSFKDEETSGEYYKNAAKNIMKEIGKLHGKP